MTDHDFLQSLLNAVGFAARAHQGQLRKDGRTPYVAHVFRVFLIIRHVFGIDDTQILTAALLHDTVEDTTTDYDDLLKHFGPDVANWVAALSKDKRLEESDREAAYVEQLRQAPWQVKVCKLGDVYDNLMDSGHLGPDQKQRGLRNARRYLPAVQDGLPDAGRKAWQIVAELLARMEKEK